MGFNDDKMETEFDIQDWMMDTLRESEDRECDDCRSFEETGVMTMNAGFTMRMANGKKYQVTIVECR